VAVPRFSYELAPPRKDRYVVSVLLHVAFFLVIWRLVPLLPPPEIETRHSKLTILYEPPPPLELKPPAPVQKILPPPKWVVSMNQPKLVTPPEPKIESPKLEVKHVLAEMKAPVVRPKLEQQVITGAFSKPADTPKPVDNKKDVVTNAFAQGTSEPATLHKPAAQVQTGGFGDPNGIRGSSDKKGPVMVASLGSFGLPAGPGNGNGTGGSRGATGTVTSAGFGDIAGGGSGNRARQGTVAQGGFGQMTTAAPAAKAHAEEKSNTKPVEILFKPKPAYTEEGRRLKIEGEVLVEVVFTAAGQLRVQRVVRGLGHGLDESALRAAQQIRFRPARRDGSPYDSTALVHIVFELAE
jgi:TonB family protein